MLRQDLISLFLEFEPAHVVPRARFRAKALVEAMETRHYYAVCGGLGKFPPPSLPLTLRHLESSAGACRERFIVWIAALAPSFTCPGYVVMGCLEDRKS